VCESSGIILAGSVLHIQGDHITAQPCVDVDNNILLWNGEVFGGIEGMDGGDGDDDGTSDTRIVSDRLRECVSKAGAQASCSDIASAVAHTICTVEGPYAFIYFHAASETVVYGRDPFGRRSLLALSECSFTNDDTRNRHILLSSVCCNSSPLPECLKWEELTVGGVYAQRNGETLQVPWPENRLRLGVIPPASTPSDHNVVGAAKYAQGFLDALMFGMSRRIRRVHDLDSSDIPTAGEESTCAVGVLFSGGVDSVLLAAALHLSLPSHLGTCVIDLINVTFDIEGQTTLSPDRLSAIASLGELQMVFPERNWRLVHVDIDTQERCRHETHIMGLIHPLCTHMDLNIGTAFWFAARGEGYLRSYSAEDLTNAYSIEEKGRPLVRRGAEGARLGAGKKSTDCRDTHTSNAGREVCSAPGCGRVGKTGCPYLLCRRCCLRKREERSGDASGEGSGCPAHRSRGEQNKKNTPALSKYEKVVEELPGCVRGSGIQEGDTPYRSECRVLLVGIGADEQLGGYGRHRTVFQRGGEDSLRREIQSDTARLWTRNLGRDDRCVSDHGRECWFPFIDEHVVSFLEKTPLDMRCDFSLPMGVGDKKILRDAALILGLSNTAELVKRAIQFGTRIAKHTNVQFHGSNRKGKGTTKITAVEDT